MSKNLRKCSWNAFCFSVNGFKQTSGLACLSMVSAWWEKRQYCQGFKCGLSGLWKDVSSVECSQLLECFLWEQWFLECVPLRWKRTRKDVFIWVHVFCAFVFVILIRLHLFHFLFKFSFSYFFIRMFSAYVNIQYIYIFQPYKIVFSTLVNNNIHDKFITIMRPEWLQCFWYDSCPPLLWVRYVLYRPKPFPRLTKVTPSRLPPLLPSPTDGKHSLFPPHTTEEDGSVLLLLQNPMHVGD